MKPESKEIVAMMDGYKKSFILAAAIRLKVFDRIGVGWVDIPELATECIIKTDPMRRLLRALNSMDLVAVVGDEVSVTQLGKSIFNDPELRDYLLVSSHDWLPAWSDLYHALNYGKFSDGSSWKKRSAKPEVDFAFHNLMLNSGTPNIPVHVGNGDGSTIIDLGGGYGHTLVSVLKLNPTFKGVLFDLPSVIKIARYYTIDSFRCPNPIEFIEGSFLDSVPPGGDLYILSNILHDWDDDCAKKIINNCYKAMKFGAKLIVTETFIPENGNNEYASMTDIHLMAVHGGRKRTRTEYLTMLTTAGFSIVSKYLDSIEVRK